MNFGDRTEEAKGLLKEANKLSNPSILGFRVKGDWTQSTPLYERAALLFRQSGDHRAAKDAWEKAAQGHVAQRSNWHAAKAMERAGDAAVALADWVEVQAAFGRAADLYLEEGRPGTAADALVKAAKALESPDPAAASKTYAKALDWVEHGGKEGLAPEAYRAAIGHAVVCRRWAEAVALLARFAAACEGVGAANSMIKAFLGAVVVWLVAGDANSAWCTYQDALAVSDFNSSNEALAAQALLEAYRSGDGAAVAAAVREQHCFAHLEPCVARLAMKLPGEGVDLGAMAAALGGDAVPVLDDAGEEDLT